jgi:Prokaryotic cytochrome b561
MSRASSRKRKTDYGTIVLHWLLVGALMVAIFSGVRIAGETPDRTWINMFDAVLPETTVWTAHIQSALVLVGVALGYAIYIPLAGLGRRIRLDGVRLRGLFGRSPARWGAINIVLYWLLFLTMLSQLVTGGLMYFSIANSLLVNLHWFGTWVIVSYPLLHVLAHLKLGGIAQLLRVFNPAPIMSPPPPLDLAELLTLYAEQSAQSPAPPPAERGQAADRRQAPRPFEGPGRDRAPERPTMGRVAEPPGGPRRRSEFIANGSRGR